MVCSALIAVTLSGALASWVIRWQQRIFEDRKAELDRLVADQTAELTHVGQELSKEIEIHQQTEEALHDREEKFRQMADQIEEVFWIIGVRTQEVIYLSPAFERVTGRKVIDTLASPLSYRDIIHPLDRNRVLHNLSRTAETKRFDEIFRILRTDGEVRWVSTQGYGVCDSSGRVYRVVGVSQDITESKRQEDAYRRLASIVEYSDDAIISNDLNGIIQSWNHAAKRIFGYTEKEVLGKSVALLIPEESYAQENDILRRVREGEHIQHYQTVRLTKSGEPIDLSLTMSPIRDAGGTIIGASEIARDIRDYKRVQGELEQREHESKARAQQLATILDAIPGLALIAQDRECHQIVGGRTAYDLLRSPYGSNLSKSAPANEVPTTFRATRNGVEIPPDHLPLQLATAEGREIRDSELTVTFEDGTSRDFVGNAAPLRNGDGKVSGAVGVFIDITQRNIAERALQEMRERLARVSRSLTMGELTANIAHEVKQPLTAAITDIGAALRWMAQTPPNLQETSGALMAAVLEANRASDVIGRIRDLAKNTPPTMLKVDLDDLTKEVLRIVDRELHACGIRVTMVINPEAAYVTADRIQLQQVLLNLIMNSIDATRPITSRPRRLQITAEPHLSDVLIRIQDNGTGIDPQHMNQLFECFFTTKIHGIGMGLSICRSIIEAHGGEIWAKSVSPHGAAFQFTLKPGR